MKLAASRGEITLNSCRNAVIDIQRLFTDDDYNYFGMLDSYPLEVAEFFRRLAQDAGPK